ncbi:MAG: pyridoxamine 5'-phosphate oxidase family protein [Desulfocapsaceae bacterium]|nr:pyridoxamine 5'-phosphate oxidase family protein [Desulfocapsaceae bacterium]
MRRRQSAITDQMTVRRLLVRCRVGRLASTGRDGYPYITPVNYVFFQDAIYFHCARQGEKLDNILADSRVCFEIDIPLAYLDLAFDPVRPPCQVHQFYHCIIIRGRAEIVEDLTEKVAALNALMAVHEGQPDFAAITADAQAVGLCAVIAVRIERLSCKSDLAQKKSPEERRRIADYLRERGLPGDEEAARLLES